MLRFLIRRWSTKKAQLGFDIVGESHFLTHIMWMVSIKNQLPLKYNFAATSRLFNNKASGECIQTNHNITTQREAITQLETYNSQQWRISYSCKKPLQCKKYLQATLKYQIQKYNATYNDSDHDNLNHTPNRQNHNTTNSVQNNTITFNPNITTSDDIMNTIRIFKTTRTYKHIPTKKLPNPPIFPKAHNRLTPPPTIINTNLTFYTDGSAENLHHNNAKAGAGMICIEQPNLSIKHSLIGEPLNNQRAELAAILLALQQNHHANITIYSDSLTSLEGITKHIQFWDDKNWFGIKNAPEWQAIYHTLISRMGTTSFHWVKGHNGDPNNELADKWAKDSLQLNPTPLPCNFPSTAPLEGMKLQILSQKLAYEKIIDSLKTSTVPNRQLINNLNIAKNDLLTEFNINPPTSKIWTGLSQPIHNNISNFIWKLIHNRIHIGNYFLHIPQHWGRIRGFFM